jgi:hypothetical protein
MTGEHPSGPPSPRASGGKATARPSVADERADAQARQRIERARRKAEMAADFRDGHPGRWIEVVSWAGTAVFAATAVLSATVRFDDDLDPPGDVAGAVVALVIFAVGCVLFLAALYLGAQRSRDAEMSVGGWFFLSGVAPSAVRWSLLGSLAIEVVVALATALARPYSTLAFGILVPVFGLALAGIWGARHGAFPPRVSP